VCLCTYQTEPELITVSSVGERSGTLGREMGIVEQARIEVDENDLKRCVRGELVYEADIENLECPFVARLARAGLRSLVAAPLMVESEVFGVLLVARARADAFSSDDCEFLRQLSSHVALAAHQARLYERVAGRVPGLRQTQQTVMQQERLRALGQIASGIAHDINNALSPPRCMRSRCSRTSRDSASARSDSSPSSSAPSTTWRAPSSACARSTCRAARAHADAGGLNQILMQVIDLTRARWSNMPLERGVVHRVESDLDANCRRSSARKTRCVTPHQPAAECRRRMPEGGTITLRTRQRDARRPVIVEVQDTGVGMSETTRSRCLEPFFTTKGERGTGSGCPWCSAWCSARRRARDRQRARRGTTMRMIFPRAPTGISRASMVPPPPRPLRLLLDRRRSRCCCESLRDALELDEHEVVTAEAARRASTRSLAEPERRNSTR
jgi:signal transduction histidine kinase